jgi:hypothetical protein
MRLMNQPNALQSKYRDQANKKQNNPDPPLNVAGDAETNKSRPESKQDGDQRASCGIKTKLALARFTLPARPGPRTEIKTRPTYPMATVGAAVTMELRFHVWIHTIPAQGKVQTANGQVMCTNFLTQRRRGCRGRKRRQKDWGKNITTDEGGWTRMI